MSNSPPQNSATQDGFTHPTKRQQAAYFLAQVIEDRMEPRLAINRWPVLEDGEEDVSLRIAHQALWHFESDEEKQSSEVFFMDAQLELLRQIAWYLRQNQDLPEYILKWYTEEHRPRFYKSQTFWEWLWAGSFQRVIHFGNFLIGWFRFVCSTFLLWRR